MSLLSIHAPMSVSIRGAARAWKTCVPARLKLVIAAAILLLASDQVWIGLQSPARAIRSGLAAAAEDTATLRWTTPPDEVRQAIAAHFPGYDVRVDPTRFPVEVSVVLPAVGRTTCLEARALARRIEGAVVVALDGYPHATDCRGENDMTWRIMP
ncbi:MAG TPA: hypothetical protein VMA53_22400 [Stellaceae bacterium]|nr:hypothetical protein [Stellaceae bacterium]